MGNQRIKTKHWHCTLENLLNFYTLMYLLTLMIVYLQDVNNMEEETITISNWEDEYKQDRPIGDSNWFSDVVEAGEISFTAEITFKSEGEKVTNKFGKEVIRFLIQHEGKEKTMEVGCNQFDYLKILAQAKPLVNKKAIHQRSGSTQKDTRRTIKVL